MNRLFAYVGRPVVVAIGARFRRSASQQGQLAALSVNWEVDETVVALTRAAISRGIPLAVPLDMHFAPLVAYVASEYVSPEVAEGQGERELKGEAREGFRAVTFMTLGDSSRPVKPRAVPKWADQFRELKVVSDQVQPLQEFMEFSRPLAAVGIGHGQKVNAVLSASRLRELPCWRLAIPPSHGGRPRVGESFAQLVEAKLVQLRKELVFMPIGERLRLRSGASEAEEHDVPPHFRAYPPLGLYAQMLIEHLAQDKHPDTDVLA